MKARLGSFNWRGTEHRVPAYCYAKNVPPGVSKGWSPPPSTPDTEYRDTNCLSDFTYGYDFFVVSAGSNIEPADEHFESAISF